MMPCPVCVGRMVYRTRRPIAPEVEDIVYACRRCGAELIRTSARQDLPPDQLKSAAAA